MTKQQIKAYGQEHEIVANKNSTAVYPMIVLKVPHQLSPKAYLIENESALYEMAKHEGGDNWYFPGHYENPDNEDGDWIDETTVSDMKDAIAHDMHVAYFISEADFPAFILGCNQGFIARESVNRLAVMLGWLEPIEDVNE